MKVIALLKGAYTVSCFHDVTSITATASTITVTGILEGSNSQTAQQFALVKERYIVRIIEN